MKVKFCFEDSRPKLFWFENLDGEDVTEVFFLGDIKRKYDMVKRLGNEIINEDILKEWL